MMVDIAAVTDELEALRARLGAIEGPGTAELVEAMRTALEELRVAEEELSRQNDELAKLQVAVAEEAARYRALFDFAPVAFVTTNGHGVITEANEATAALLGVDPRLLIGKPLPLYVDEPARAELRSSALRLTATGGGGAASFSVRMRRQDGVAFDAVVNARSLGEAVQWVVQDVTAERRTEQRPWEINRELETRVAEQAGELGTVLEQLPVGVLIVEPETLVLRQANRRAQEILGDRVVAGAPIRFDEFERFDVDGRPVDPAGWPVTRALAGEEVEGEIVVLVLPDEQRLTLEIDAVPARGADGRVTGAIVTFDDVTAREARERAEREFVTNAAHELRTPLTAIATAVEVLQSGAKEIPEERDIFLAHLERECGRLSRLGSALLSLARMQAQEEAPPAEVLPMHDVLERVAGSLDVADSVKLTVACARDIAAVANRNLVEQAIWNLATNAARHTRAGKVALSAALVDDHTVVEVRDTGPGIPAEARSRLFERFYRAGARDAEGFGLGLAIAKQSVEAVGGMLTIESDDQTGTTARIMLPSAKLL